MSSFAEAYNKQEHLTMFICDLASSVTQHRGPASLTLHLPTPSLSYLSNPVGPFFDHTAEWLDLMYIIDVGEKSHKRSDPKN
jgi:hypothetical protein